LSCYSDGLMGYRTPNIDRIASEGMRFTDSYGEQSCTARRAAFISGHVEYKVHIDGFNLMPYLMGEVEHSPRRGFFYFNDDAELVAMRYENWKIVFAEQRCQGTLRIWAEPFTPLRVPKLDTFKEFPPRHEPASFSIDQIVKKLNEFLAAD
jgi:arylsulfatase A-like enzyme